MIKLLTSHTIMTEKGRSLSKLGSHLYFEAAFSRNRNFHHKSELPCLPNLGSYTAMMTSLPNTAKSYKVTMSRSRHWRNFAINIYSVALTT